MCKLLESKCFFCPPIAVHQMTNAMLNSLEISPSQKLDDDCMRISVALSPTSANNIVTPGPSKTAITNASFK